MKMLELSIPPLPQFITVGHSCWKAGQSHFKRTWNIYDLILVVTGTLYITENGTPYAITPGHMLLLEPGRTHWGHLPCTEDTETYFLHFSHSAPLREIESDSITWTDSLHNRSDFDPSVRSHFMYIPKHAEIRLSHLIPLLDKMLEIKNHFFVQNALQLHCLGAEFLLELQNIAHYHKLKSRSLELCTRIARYLENRLLEPFSSKLLESEFHYHIDYLSRCMKKHSGMTPLQYLQHIRIERSKSMLSNSMSSIQAISNAVGFQHSNYFIRIFCAKVGVTPGHYRELTQGNMIRTAEELKPSHNTLYSKKQ